MLRDPLLLLQRFLHPVGAHEGNSGDVAKDHNNIFWILFIRSLFITLYDKWQYWNTFSSSSSWLYESAVVVIINLLLLFTGLHPLPGRINFRDRWTGQWGYKNASRVNTCNPFFFLPHLSLDSTSTEIWIQSQSSTSSNDVSEPRYARPRRTHGDVVERGLLGRFKKLMTAEWYLYK